MYLENLFVREVLEWNLPAIHFYQSIGSHVATDWRFVRLEGDALNRLAGTQGTSI